MIKSFFFSVVIEIDIYRRISENEAIRQDKY